MRSIFHKNFKKFVRKIRAETLFNLIKSKVDGVIETPAKGKLLEQPFRKYKVRGISFDYKNNSYRIAYLLNKGENEIVFLLIDSRENFYSKLKKIL